MQRLCWVSASITSSSIRHLCQPNSHSRGLRTTLIRNEVTNLAMPAMSPTMTEGGISQWKKKEGESFSAGDVLLEVETDKATIDVEAPEDGVMGKILLPDGSKNIPVGKVIALLAEEGDDLSKLEPPKEEFSSSSSSKVSEPKKEEPIQTAQTAQPSSIPATHDIDIHHSRPLFPSVLRLLLENRIEDADKIKGTGVRGMLTKGDVLSFLGKATSPMGTYKEAKAGVPSSKKVEEPKPLSGPAIRHLIASSLLQNSLRAKSIPFATHSYDFDSIVADYLPPSNTGSAPNSLSSNSKPKPLTSSFLDGLI